MEELLPPPGQPETDDSEPLWQAFGFSVPAPHGAHVLAWRLRAALADGSWVDLGDARDAALASQEWNRILPSFLEALQSQPTGTIVEIGGRARSGVVRTELFPAGWKYVGCDIKAGPNVDVVCDAHELSAHFEPESVDAMFSISTFEHLAMPWKVVIEMSRIMKQGAVAFICSHQHTSLRARWAPHGLTRQGASSKRTL